MFENVESTNYLGVTITYNFQWDARINNVCIKANKTLRFLNFVLLPQDVKESTYKELGRLV